MAIEVRMRIPGATRWSISTFEEVLGVANQEDHDTLVGYCFMYGADPSKIVVCEFNYWKICDLPLKPDYIVKFEDL